MTLSDAPRSDGDADNETRALSSGHEDIYGCRTIAKEISERIHYIGSGLEALRHLLTVHL